MHAQLSPQFYQMLFDNAPIGLALCRMDGKLVDVNKAYADILGRTVEETLELSYWEITPKKYELQEGEQLEAMKKEGRYGPYEKDYLNHDGKLVPVRLSGVVVEIEGEKYIWSRVEDLTEEKYRTLFQSAHPPLALCDMDGQVLLVNKAFACLLGRSVDETVGVSFWRLTPKGATEKDQDCLRKLANEGLFKDYATRFRPRSGKDFPVTVHGMRLPIHRKNYDLFYVEKGEWGGDVVQDAEAFEWEDLTCLDDPECLLPIKEPVRRSAPPS